MAKVHIPSRDWRGYYRMTAKRPPNELVGKVLNHIEWEGRSGARRTAIDLGSGAGNESLEFLRRGWRVLAIDQQEAAARFLIDRTPPRWRSRLTTLVAPFEGLELPRSDLVHASFSIPFCDPEQFPALWTSIKGSLHPGGHFAGQLFGDHDEWAGKRPMSFHGRSQITRLARGWKVELLRETEEEARSCHGGKKWVPKHWHYFDLILEKPAR